MTTSVMKADGTLTSMYRAVNKIVIGSDQDFTTFIELSTESLLHGLEKLGYLVVPIEDTE